MSCVRPYRGPAEVQAGDLVTQFHDHMERETFSTSVVFGVCIEQGRARPWATVVAGEPVTGVERKGVWLKNLLEDYLVIVDEDGEKLRPPGVA